MANQKIKIAVPPTSYTALKTLGAAVFLSMEGNLDFPTPAPPLTDIEAATTALTNAITAWGTKGHRGSQLDLTNLRIAATTLRNLLILEAAYVMNLVNLNATPLEQKAFINSSGFAVKDARSPQGVLGAPQNVRQLIQKNLTPYTPKIKWAKPPALTSVNNVRSYNIFRSVTNDYSTAAYIGITTKTSFVDMAAPKGTTQYYFVAGVNTNGLGVASAGITVLIPN